MKKSFIVAWLGLALLPARADLLVYDPTVNAQQIANTAKEIAKFTEMINNQVQQIQTLANQLNEFKQYEVLFGNPAQVLLGALQPLVNDLAKTELGKALITLQATVDASQAMAYDANGLFHSIGATFTTPSGQTVTRQQDAYLPLGAVQKTTDNYLAVSNESAARRILLKSDIILATEQLKAATNNAQVQKLIGVLSGLSTALNNTEFELNQAATSALVQDVANRNDQQRQLEAQKEQMHAEFTEAIQQYGKKFRLMNAPALFPTQ